MVEQSLIPGTPYPMFTRSGAADFYATIDPTPGVSRLHGVAYGADTVRSRFFILEPNYVAIPLHPEGATRVRSSLEVFLMTLYGAQLNIFKELDSVDESFNLDAQILAAGEEDQYNAIQIVDFLALTGAVSRFWRKPGNGTINILNLGPDDERPEISELDPGDGGIQLFQVIKYIGLFSMVKRLFVAGAITFDRMAELYKWFYPGTAERFEKVFGKVPNDPSSLQAFLVSRRHPLLTDSQKNILIS